MSATAALLTAEEYFRSRDAGRPTELVRGKIVMMNAPGARHGHVCNLIGEQLGRFVRDRDCGYVLSNDAGVLVTRDPDTVRGADLAYYSYDRISKGALPTGYPESAPELVFEVLPPSDRWSDVCQKSADYLGAGVACVCVVDPERRQATCFYSDEPQRALAESESLTFPSILPGFTLRLATLFTA